MGREERRARWRGGEREKDGMERRGEREGGKEEEIKQE